MLDIFPKPSFQAGAEKEGTPEFSEKRRMDSMTPVHRVTVPQPGTKEVEDALTGHELQEPRVGVELI